MALRSCMKSGDYESLFTLVWALFPSTLCPSNPKCASPAPLVSCGIVGGSGLLTHRDGDSRSTVLSGLRGSRGSFLPHAHCLAPGILRLPHSPVGFHCFGCKGEISFNMLGKGGFVMELKYKTAICFKIGH